MIMISTTEGIKNLADLARHFNLQSQRLQKAYKRGGADEVFKIIGEQYRPEDFDEEPDEDEVFQPQGKRQRITFSTPPERISVKQDPLSRILTIEQAERLTKQTEYEAFERRGTY